MTSRALSVLSARVKKTPVQVKKLPLSDIAILLAFFVNGPGRFSFETVTLPPVWRINYMSLHLHKSYPMVTGVASLPIPIRENRGKSGMPTVHCKVVPGPVFLGLSVPEPLRPLLSNANERLAPTLLASTSVIRTSEKIK